MVLPVTQYWSATRTTLSLNAIRYVVCRAGAYFSLNSAGRGAGSSKTTTTGGFCAGGGYTTVTFDEGGDHWPRAPVASTQHTKLRTSNLIYAFLHGPKASRRQNALRRRSGPSIYW